MDAQTGGHSLQELLITLGLVSILYATTIPMLRPPGAKDEAGRFTQALTRALNQARGIAVASGERVMFCGSLDGRKCSRVWPGDVELLVFTDRDNNRQLSEADTLHLQQPLRLQHARGVWRGSLARPYLRFRATGTAIEYGRFSYCPKNADARDFRQLVINRVGRVYQHHDGTGRRNHCKG